METTLTFGIWWRDTDPHEIHMATNDRRFTDESGSRPGVWVTFSSNPRSANYSPANFNRLARALRAAGEPAPPEDTPLRPRGLKQRPRTISELGFAQL